MNEHDLMKLKKQLEQEEKQLQRNEGKLERLYDDLYEILNVDSDTPKKEAINLANKEVKKLNTKIKKEQKRLDSLLDEIEEEVSEWDD